MGTLSRNLAETIGHESGSFDFDIAARPRPRINDCILIYARIAEMQLYCNDVLLQAQDQIIAKNNAMR